VLGTVENKLLRTQGHTPSILMGAGRAGAETNAVVIVV
jgi:hypothetical protein